MNAFRNVLENLPLIHRPQFHCCPGPDLEPRAARLRYGEANFLRFWNCKSTDQMWAHCHWHRQRESASGKTWDPTLTIPAVGCTDHLSCLKGKQREKVGSGTVGKQHTIIQFSLVTLLVVDQILPVQALQQFQVVVVQPKQVLEVVNVRIFDLREKRFHITDMDEDLGVFFNRAIPIDVLS